MHDENFPQPLTFTVPLTASNRRLARQFQQQQTKPIKAQQIYLNTLAVCAVQFYLRCMGIETNWQASCSWNPIWQALADIADLEIPRLGKLECRPVLAEANVIYIPPEVWSERIGYVAVKLDRALQQATLLGFTPTAGDREQIAISELLSLSDLLEHLHRLQQEEVSDRQCHLSQWFQAVFEGGWLPLASFLADDRHSNLALSLRNSSDLTNSVEGAKLIDLGIRIKERFFVLLVAIAPVETQKVAIRVQLHPTGQETFLPADLKLSLLSELEVSLQEVISRPQDNYIQLKLFRVLPGECFKIQVAFGKASVIETFKI
jgi:hypothetical protein